MRAAVRWTLIGGAVLSVALLVAAAADGPKPRPPDVVMIVVDTLRADRLGAYGNRRGLTPFLDKMVEHAHVVERAYSAASWTSPSVASIFTSRFPSQHGIIGFSAVLADHETTLAEVLHAAGYATAGFSANGLISKKSGFDQGFDTYRAYLEMERFTRPARRADEITNEALHWLETMRQRDATKPVFLYLHYMEPHPPYAPPPELLQRLRGPNPLDVNALNLALVTFGPPATELMNDIRDVYDAEVMAIDAALGRLVAALEHRGVDRHALLVMTADHGEELRDHGALGHGKTLYNEVTHVPLIVRTPGETRGHVIDRVISSIDIAPTVLDEAGIEIPSTFEGVSFARDLEVQGMASSIRRFVGRWWDERPPPVAFSEHYALPPVDPDKPLHQNAVVRDHGKVIAWTDGRRDFFSLADDPGEQEPDRTEGAQRQALVASLDEMRRRVSSNRTTAEERTIDPRTRDALRALGYVH